MNDKEMNKWIEFFDENDDVLGGANANDFVDASNKYEYLEKYRKNIDEIPNAPEIPSMPTVDKTIASIKKTYGDIDKVAPARLYTMAENAGVSVDDLKQAWNEKVELENEYKTVDEKYQARERRRKELENIPFTKILMNEASKRRYIDEPEKSAFWQEKQKAEGDTTKYDIPWSDYADIALGGAGAVADLLPGMFGVIPGPVLRSARDIKNKITGESDKSIRELTRSFGSDLVSNVGVNYGPTAILNAISKRSKSAQKDLSSLKDAIWEGGVIGTARQMKKDLGELTSLTKASLSKKQKIIDESPDVLKELRKEGIRTQKEANVERKFADDLTGNVFENDIRELAKREDISELEAAKQYTDKMNRGDYSNAYDTFTENGKTIVIETPAVQKTLEKTLGPTARKYNEASAMAKSAGKGGKTMYALTKGFDVVGPRAVKETGVATREYDIPDSKYNKMLDDTIKSNERMWKAGFVPNKVPGDVMYEAWLKWKNRGEE